MSEVERILASSPTLTSDIWSRVNEASQGEGRVLGIVALHRVVVVSGEDLVVVEVAEVEALLLPPVGGLWEERAG